MIIKEFLKRVMFLLRIDLASFAYDAHIVHIVKVNLVKLYLH